MFTRIVALIGHTRRTTTLQEMILTLLALYIASVALAVLLGQTILLGAAISLYVINPTVLTLHWMQNVRAKKNDVRTVLSCLLYLSIVLVVATLLLYVTLIYWNPDHFQYDFAHPTLAQELGGLILLQLPWIGTGLLLSVGTLLCSMAAKPQKK